MPRIHTDYTLGTLLSSSDSIIKRNAMSILKRLQGLQRVIDDIAPTTHRLPDLDDIKLESDPCDLCTPDNCAHACHSRDDHN